MDIYYDGLIYCLQARGGISRYFTQLIETMNQLAVNTELILPQPNRAALPQSTKIKRTFVPFSNRVQQLQELSDARYLGYISQLKSGILHSSYYQRYKDVSIPVVVTVYDLIYEQYPKDFSKPAEKAFVKQKAKSIHQADAAICISQTIKDQLLETYDLDKSKVYAIPLGVDTNFANHHSAATGVKNPQFDRPYFLYVGQRGKYKNFMRLLKAYDQSKAKDSYDLVCVGGGDRTEEETAFLEEKSLSSKVHLVQNVTDAELAQLYQQAYAYVSSSLAEGFGLPLLEAMLSNCPLLISDIAVYHEVAGKVADYFDPHSIESIRQSLDSFKPDRKKVATGTKRAKQFTWERTAQETLEVYKSLL